MAKRSSWDFPKTVRAGVLALSVAWAGAASAAKYPITVRGSGEGSFSTTPPTESKVDPGKYDVIVVGSGLAGLSASLYLSDQGKKVLLVEKEPTLGGLASGGEVGTGERYGRGAAYWTDTYREELQILKHIGLGDFKKTRAIPEPIDNYFWNGKLYVGVWDDATLAQLPSSFAVFRQELSLEGDSIPDQPIEENADQDLDRYSAADYIRSMPDRLSRREDSVSRTVYQAFLADKRLNPADPMRDVVDFLDLYCRSALGSNAAQVSAMAFANFYISEIVTRYTSDIGTGVAAQNMIERLSRRPELVTVKTSAPAIAIRNTTKGVHVRYAQDGIAWDAKAKYAIYAGQLKFAPQLIEGFSKGAPEQAGLMSGMQYANYSVHIVRSQGHPYRAAYDTWTRSADYTEQDFTDVILGRWMDPEINGYQGMRDFSKNPPDDNGVFTIYHPLPLSSVGEGYSEDDARAVAERAVDRLLAQYNPLLAASWGTHIDVVSVETNRWPYSIHVAVPGHFSHKVKVMRRPFQRVFFGNNNLGTPAFEEALFRGHCAANNVLHRMDKAFHQEKWSRCPLER